MKNTIILITFFICLFIRAQSDTYFISKVEFELIRTDDISKLAISNLTPNNRHIDISVSNEKFITQDSIKMFITVSQQQFDSLIVSATSVLSNQPFIEIKDSDHVNIIRLINTLNFNMHSSSKKSHYKKFIKLLAEKDYEKQISNHYHWTPNKGMGMYFPKLQVELGGTPNEKSVYTINISLSPQGGDRDSSSPQGGDRD